MHLLDIDQIEKFSKRSDVGPEPLNIDEIWFYYILELWRLERYPGQKPFRKQNWKE